MAWVAAVALAVACIAAGQCLHWCYSVQGEGAGSQLQGMHCLIHIIPVHLDQSNEGTHLQQQVHVAHTPAIALMCMPTAL